MKILKKKIMKEEASEYLFVNGQKVTEEIRL